jgi:Zn-dependent peptidase ImmA (M78 family)
MEQKPYTYTDSPKYRLSWSEEEYEADLFAYALLMPETEFRAYCKEHAVDGKLDAEKLARHFGVDVNTALRRGRQLEIIRGFA